MIPPSLSLSLSRCLYFLAWHITLESHLPSLSPSLCIFARSPSLSHTHSDEPGACVREDEMCHGVVGCFMWMLFKCVLTHSTAAVTLVAVCAPANRPSWLATCSAEPRGKWERENYLAIMTHQYVLLVFGLIFADLMMMMMILFFLVMMMVMMMHCDCLHWCHRLSPVSWRGDSLCFASVFACVNSWDLPFCLSSDRLIYWSGWLIGRSLHCHFEIIGIGQQPAPKFTFCHTCQWWWHWRLE